VELSAFSSQLSALSGEMTRCRHLLVWGWRAGTSFGTAA